MENVYLFELDSVRNSAKEIEIAQRSLYRELLLNGNNVVITYNQLSDSQFFLTMLKSDKHYKMLMDMFNKGYMKVSVFRSFVEDKDGIRREVRTASQYIQNALQKALDSKDDYHFSGTPISRKDPYLLDEVRISLKNSDPELLSEDFSKLEEFKNYLNNYKKGAKAYLEEHGNDFVRNAYKRYEKTNKNKIELIDADIERLKMFYKYVHLVLLVSQQKIAYTTSSRASSGKDLVSNINRAINVFTSDKCKYDDQEFKELYNEAIQDIAKANLENANNRSVWYKRIDSKKKTNKDLLAMEEMIIDVCYNFTCQFSISGIDSNELYKDENGKFLNKFFDELYSYYLNYKKGIHQTHEIIEKVDDNLKPLKGIEWQTAYEIRNDVEAFVIKKPSIKDASWDRKVIRTQHWNTLASVAIMVILFVVFNMCFDLVTGTFENVSGLSAILNNAAAHIVLYILVAILETIIFGLVSSFLSERWNIVDILDIAKTLKIKMHRLRVYKKERKEVLTDGRLYQ